MTGHRDRLSKHTHVNGGQGVSEGQYVGLSESRAEGGESIEGREFDALIDRVGPQFLVEGMQAIHELEDPERDAEPLDRPRVERGRRRTHTTPFDLDRCEPIVILVDQCVEEIEGDPANQESGSRYEFFSIAASIRRLKFGKGWAPDRYLPLMKNEGVPVTPSLLAC